MFSDDSITLPTITRNSNVSKLKWTHASRMGVTFKESCVKQDKATSTHKNVINLFMSYTF